MRKNKENTGLLGAVVRKIKFQLPPHSPEARLMFAVFESVARDLLLTGIKTHTPTGRPSTSSFRQKTAQLYMWSNMPHLDAVGINPVWVRKIFREAGLEYLYLPMKGESYEQFETKKL